MSKRKNPMRIHAPAGLGEWRRTMREKYKTSAKVYSKASRKQNKVTP